jgi:methyl-accepting chemotaxis protein
MEREAAMENMVNLTGVTAKDIQSRYQTYMDIAKTISYIFNSYDLVDEHIRRTRYNETLAGVISSNPSFVSIYTLWKPNAIDGRDTDYANTEGTDSNGQYISCYTRESGRLELTAYRDYQSILATLSTNDTISNPVSRIINGQETFIIDIRVPIVSKLSVVGLVGITVDIAFLQSIVQGLTPYGSGHAAVYANDGTIAAHYDREIRGTHFQQSSMKALSQEGVNTILDSIKTGIPATIISNGSILVSYPYNVGSATTAWTVITLAPLNTVLASVSILTRFAIGFVLAGGIVAAIIIFLTSSSLSKRILLVGDRMKDISEGEGDLTERLVIRANDEIGRMGGYFNQTLDKIRNLVVLIKKQSGNLATIGDELTSNMTETTASVNEIAATIQSIKSQVGNQSESVSENNTTMRDMTAAIEQLTKQIETQSAHVSQASSAIEEMLANIASVTETLVKNDVNVKRLSQASEVGRTGLQEVATDIQEIAKESEGLIEITEVMENIAGQTNLLSMNAAIEAAHAGESGKGFAVVADEIRKLAESSGEQSKTIAAVLKKIKESIDRISKSTDMVIDRFEAIDRNIKTVSEQEENVRSSMEEQGTGSQHILESISTLNDITQIIKNGSIQMRTGSRKIIEESKHLEAVTLEISNGTNEIAQGAEEINTAINHVSGITNENKRSIDVLISEISMFKVD